MPITRLGFAGYGVERTGSFAGKTPAGSYTLSADAGTFSISGQAASFDLKTSVAASSYSVSGTAASFDTGLMPAAGSYVVTGVAALLTAIGGKSGVARLSSIEAQRVADRQKKRRVKYAVDALKEDIKPKKDEPVKLEPEAKAQVKAVVKEKADSRSEPLVIAQDVAKGILDSVTEKAKTRKTKKKDASLPLDAAKDAVAEKKRLEEIAKAEADAKARLVAKASRAADKVVAGSISPLALILSGVREKVEARVRTVDGLDEADIQHVTDKALGVMTTEDLLAIMLLDMEKRHKREMMKMMLMLSQD